MVRCIAWLDLWERRRLRGFATPRKNTAKRNHQRRERGGSKTTEQDKSAVSLPGFASSSMANVIAGSEIRRRGVAHARPGTGHGTDNRQSSDEEYD